MNDPKDNKDRDSVIKEVTPVVVVLLYLGIKPLANPQIIKPDVLYGITGQVEINIWPEGYHLLELVPVTTTDDSWYPVSLPRIKKINEKVISINGRFIVKQPQNLLDPPIVIKLMAVY